MTFQLTAYGRVDLDGTHRAMIETNLSECAPLFGEINASPRYVKLQNSGKACACLLDEIKRGDANRIWIDQFKQRYLQIKDGDPIEVEVIHPPAAQKLALRVPHDFIERDSSRLIGKLVTKNEKCVLYSFSGDPRIIVVADVVPNGIAVITADTDISTSGMESEEAPVTYKDIGGLNNEIKLIREVVEYPLRFPEVFEHLGVSQPRGIILYGPPGTGKTLIARALATEVGAKFYAISGPEIFGMWYGESERKLRDVFEEARKNAPSVILIDELDSLTPKRDSTHGELEQRIVATMLTLMDGLRQLKGVVVVGTTNRINSIDIALRREGRFGHEIHIGVPDFSGRRDILKIHANRMPLSSDTDLDYIAERTVGFVGSDISALCREAAYNALRRSFPPESFEKGQIIPYQGLEIGRVDFEKAIPVIPPSAMKELLIEIPKVSWDDIGGLEDVKRLLVENIAYAITKSEVYKKVGIKPARGILLYGPPGTGKTLLAKAVASQCGANFIGVKGPEMHSKWVGEAEERIRFLFSKAREVAPCVIFFDEIDSAAPARGRNDSGHTDTIVNQILSEMDGIESTEGVFVIGATNRAELLDPALLRPGRFDFHIEVPLPNSAARTAIFKAHLKGKPIAREMNIEELVCFTDGYSGAEIAEACRQGTWEAVREAGYESERVEVTITHIRNALANVQQTREKLTKRPIGYDLRGDNR